MNFFKFKYNKKVITKLKINEESNSEPIPYLDWVIVVNAENILGSLLTSLTIKKLNKEVPIIKMKGFKIILSLFGISTSHLLGLRYPWLKNLYS